MKKLLFIVNVDWFFVSHRLPIAKKAVEEGFEVHLACDVTDKLEEIREAGITVHIIPFSRSGVNFFKQVGTFIDLAKVVRSVSPNIIHGISTIGVVFAGILSQFFQTERLVASISGLGYVFVDESLRARSLRWLVTFLYRMALRSASSIIFQNKDDHAIFLKRKIASNQNSILIRGSGVDLDKFYYTSEPTGDLIVMFVARLLKDKGIIEFSEAAKIIRQRANARFVVVGDLDPCNPNSLSTAELNKLIKTEHVEYWGFSDDVNQVMPRSHIIVLPSYREGLPKSLIEASACGRPVVTTDVPGCRDAIIPDVTGLLVQAKDVTGLVEAIENLLNNKQRRLSFGNAGRKLAEEHFDINGVVAKHLSIYTSEA